MVMQPWRERAERFHLMGQHDQRDHAGTGTAESSAPNWRKEQGGYEGHTASKIKMGVSFENLGSAHDDNLKQMGMEGVKRSKAVVIKTQKGRRAVQEMLEFGGKSYIATTELYDSGPYRGTASSTIHPVGATKPKPFKFPGELPGMEGAGKPLPTWKD